jgi:hypothetical protein
LRHFASSDFWPCYHRLPKQVQDLADANHELLNHPRLPSAYEPESENQSKIPTETGIDKEDILAIVQSDTLDPYDIPF